MYIFITKSRDSSSTCPQGFFFLRKVGFRLGHARRGFLFPQKSRVAYWTRPQGLSPQKRRVSYWTCPQGPFFPSEKCGFVLYMPAGAFFPQKSSVLYCTCPQGLFSLRKVGFRPSQSSPKASQSSPRASQGLALPPEVPGAVPGGVKCSQVPRLRTKSSRSELNAGSRHCPRKWCQQPLLGPPFHTRRGARMT